LFRAARKFALVLPPQLGMESLVAGITAFDVTPTQVVEAIVVFLGIPFAAGFLTRYAGTHLQSERWYDEEFVPKIDPLALVALLYTVVVMFATQDETIVAAPANVLLIAVPLTIYFVVMFLVSSGMGRGIGADYSTTTAIGFTAASNNFELAIAVAVAVAVFGVGSGIAFATVVGPLIEVPVLLALVNVALYFRRRYDWRGFGTEDAAVSPPDPAADS
jgi:ACR3 family arsenite transporter